jgi:DNA-binding CsgD family transcriptional regulator
MEGRVIETAREALNDLEEYLSAVSGPRFQRPTMGGLTPREHEVLSLLADGYTTAEVAKRLSLSEHTVRSRVKATLAKLGARNREQAVAIAIRSGAL